MASTVALIVAGGSGSRLGEGLPKQYRLLAGRPVLRHTLDVFLSHPAIAAVQVVIQPEHRAAYEAAVRGLRVAEPVAGGRTRQASVHNGLEALAAWPVPPDRVLIHDAARPFLDRATLDAVLAALEQEPAVLAAVPVVDTLKREAGGFAVGTVSRDGLWQAQTPQGFHFPAIRDAHRRFADSDSSEDSSASDPAVTPSFTDDAAVAQAAGLPVRLVCASGENFKITTAADFARAEQRLAVGGSMLADIRTGHGFDVHRFADGGDHVMLCGVAVPHRCGLEGHSDADVALHALTDALLGAVGAGDIGQHFPPTDPRWKGCPSLRFLTHAAALVAQRGGVIRHLDVTVIGERPKVSGHRAAMVARLAAALNLAPDRISVKATTTEKLGFTGRQEGLAALATATVALPLTADDGWSEPETESATGETHNG